ncbi:hypothetical protein AWN76_017280 [Rhodothermaceae bacterium RA]|nr:hypothetical protein AWN76_017280 [Rhodothermaceae bacterium RA]
MKTYFLYTLLAALSLVQVQAVYGQDSGTADNPREKRAQTGLQFLSVSMSPRAAALSDAMVAVDLGSSMAMFYNPAGMASLQGGDLALGNVQWIADIGFNGGSVAYSPADGQYGTFGFTVMAVDYGELEGTIRSDNEIGYIDTGSFSPTALAIGIGYATSLSDRFSIGGTARYVRQDLGDSIMDADMSSKSNTVSTPVFDFGVLYRTGFRSFNIGLAVRNFSPSVTYEEESFEAPLLLSIGASIDVMDLSNTVSDAHSLLVTAEAGHPRSYSEQIRLGGEYRFMNLVSLRAGYVFPTDEQGLSAGAGLNLELGGLRFGADYAYTAFGDLGNVDRLGIRIGF